MATVALEFTTRESREYPPRVTWHLVEFHYKKIPKEVNPDSGAVRELRPLIDLGRCYKRLGS